MPDVFGTLDALLAATPYIDGPAFTVSDVLVGAYLLYIPAFLPQVRVRRTVYGIAVYGGGWGCWN